MQLEPRVRNTPLAKVERILHKARVDCHDKYVPLNNIRVELKNPLAPLHRRYGLTLKAGGRETPVDLTTTSANQLCRMAGVPSQFMERVPAALGFRVLRCMTQMSSMADGRQVLLRLKEDKQSLRLRAILPQNFVRLNDLDVLKEIQNTVGSMNITVANVTVHEDLFFIRLLYGDRFNLSNRHKPDEALAGFDVLSSETGAYQTLVLRNCLVRLVCLNGLTTIVKAPGGNKLNYTQHDRNAFTSLFRDTLDQVATAGPRMAKRLGGTRDELIDDPMEELERIFRRYRLGSTKGKIGQWVVREVLKNVSLFGVRRWDICQAVTAVARDLEHRDRIRYEDAMGAYLLDKVS